MAGWNDLPNELKRMVVEMVDARGEVAGGFVILSCEEWATLLALSTMDRKLHALTAPIIWQTLPLSNASLNRLAFFAGDIGPFKGRLVRRLMLYQPNTTPDDFSTVVGVYSQLLSTVPGLNSLTLRSPSDGVTALLPLLPTSLAQTLQYLDMKGWSHLEFISSSVAATTIAAFPELIALHLSDIRQGEDKQAASLAVNALRSLQKLKVLRLGTGDGFDSRSSLTLPWKSSLLELDLGDMDGSDLDVSTLRLLLEQHASTLQDLVPPFYVNDTHFPTFCLPQLHTLTLYVNDDSAPYPLSFSASPLRDLGIEMLGEEGEVETMARRLAEAIMQHRETLASVCVQAFADEVARERDQEALDDLEALCEKKGISYYFELLGP